MESAPFPPTGTQIYGLSTAVAMRPVVSVIVVSDYAGGDFAAWDDLRSALAALARQDIDEPIEVLLVESSEHAYSHIKRVQPNLVILCMRIEDRDGFQVLSMLKLDAETREIPVLTYTCESCGDEAEDTCAEPSDTELFPAAKAAVRPCTRRAIRRSPSGPCHTAYIPAHTARSTCAVQMLLVAFSRRMCCSRVWSAIRYA